MADPILIANKWEIVRRLGKGGMGAVYEVRNKLNKRMAVKQLHADLELEKSIFDRFYREAQVMVDLKHKHIVEVIDIDSQEGFGAYILMELVAGTDLGRIIREKGPLEYREVLRIGSEVASALDYAHRRNVIHRDIKPANILIEDDSRRAVVTDFGIAKRLGDSGQTNVTGATKEFIGTYRYCAPEQFRNARDVDARVDIYSLGCVLYEMYRGKPILWEMDGIEVASRMAYSDMKLELDFETPPPPEFEEILRGCLEKDRNARIQTARQLYERLEECRRSAFTRPAPPSATVPGPAPAEAPSAPPPTPPAVPPPSRVPLAATPAAGTGLEEVSARLADELAEAPTVPLEDSVAAAVRKEQERQRALLAEQIQGLRNAVAERREDCRKLRAELAAQSVVPAGTDLLEDVDSRLRAAEQLEEEGQLENARANLEKLNDSVAALWNDMRGTLRGVLDGARKDLRQEWQALAGAAGAFLDPGAGAAFERILQPFDDALDGEDWDGCRNILTEAGQHLRRARDGAESARREAELTALRAAEETLRDLLERATQAPDRIVAKVRMEAEDFLNGDRTADAVRAREQAERLQTRLEAALAEAGLYTETVGRRQSAERAAQAAAAARPAPEDLAAVQRIETEARAAFESGDWQKAGGLYEAARRQYEALEQAAIRAAEQRRLRQEEERRLQVARAAEEARLRAEEEERLRKVEEQRRREEEDRRREAEKAARRAREEKERQNAEHERAIACRQRDAADRLKATKAERRDADRAFAEAEMLFERGDWPEAAAAYVRAAETFEQIVRAARARPAPAAQAARAAAPAPAVTPSVRPLPVPAPVREPSERRTSYAMWAGIAGAGAAVVIGGGYAVNRFVSGAGGPDAAPVAVVAASATPTPTPTETVPPTRPPLATTSPTPTRVPDTASQTRVAPSPTGVATFSFTPRATASSTATPRSTSTPPATRTHTPTRAANTATRIEDTPTAVVQVDPEKLARRWLDDLVRALTTRNAAQVALLLKLDGPAKEKLQRALDTQEDLKVTITNLRVSKVGEDRLSIRYDRADEFTNPDNGQRVSVAPKTVTQTLRIVGDRLELEK